jgi:hypothetical protein
MKNDAKVSGSAEQGLEVFGLICCNQEGCLFFVNDSKELENLLTAGIYSLVSVAAGTFEEFKRMEDVI